MTILSKLRDHAATRPNQIALRYFDAELTAKSTLTMKELDDRALLIASYLSGQIEPGDRVVLAYPQGTEFLCAFFACLYCGAIAVPTSVPNADHEDPRFTSIMLDAQPKALLSELAQAPSIEGQCTAFLPSFAGSIVYSDRLLQQTQKYSGPVQTSANEIALLQYTSGSTSAPKGVVITHKSLIANIRMAETGFQVSVDDVIASWVPNFHDMGLIASQLLAIYVGCPIYLMAAKEFIKNPTSWLRLFSEFGATVSAAPNFAFDICARLAEQGNVPQLSLSGWRTAINGSEPIHEKTLTDFINAFAPYGFQPESMAPGYGLAEVCVYVCSSPPDRLFKKTSVDRKALEEGLVRPASSPETAKSLIGCGYSPLDGEIAIVEPASRKPTASGSIGEIWLTGSHVASGYWRNDSATQAAFGQRIANDQTGKRYYKTGDLGFLHEGEIFVTGRIKDLIIIRGRNFYPQDIERIVKELEPDFFPKDTAAFSIEVDEKEQLVILQTVPAGYNIVKAKALVESLQRELAVRYEIKATQVILVNDRSLPKTTSGKIARSACCKAYRAGELQVLWDYAASDTGTLEYSLPKNFDPQSLESWLEQMVLDQFELEQVDTDKDLFDLGLDSLGLVQFICSIEEAVGHPINEMDFVKNPTISDLARLIAVEHKAGQICDAETAATLEAKSESRPKLLTRIAGRVRWHGPHMGRFPLLPYRLGSRILHWLVGKEVIQRLCYPAQIDLLTQVTHEIAHKAQLSELRAQFLHAASWRAWRQICLNWPGNFEKYVTYSGLENLTEPLDNEQGILLACPHSTLKSLINQIPLFSDMEKLIIGNFDMEQLQRYGLKDIAHHLQPRAGDYSARVRFAQIRRARSVLSRGGLVVIFPDAYTGNGGIETEFHGRARPVRPGMAELALQTGAALIPTFYQLSPDGAVRFEFMEDLMSAGDKVRHAEDVLRDYADILSEKWATDLGQFEDYALLQFLELPLFDA